MTNTENKEKQGEIRLEDLGKQVLENAEPLEEKYVHEALYKHFAKGKQYEYWLLFSKDLGYHQVFRTMEATPTELASWIQGFLEESYYQKREEEDVGIYPLGDVRHIENASSEGDSNALDVWIGTTYFQLMPFDWGVEEVGMGS